jgi:hypothetical protein
MSPQAAFAAYDTGARVGLWKNPEEHLSYLDGLAADAIRLHAFGQIFGSNETQNADRYWSQASQFVAIATSFFVDLVKDHRVLPDSWLPYTNWASTLTKNDSILTFNYDRVVEEAFAKSGATPHSIIHLHGEVPRPGDLVDKIRRGSPIDSISTPGLNKVKARNEHLSTKWSEAATILRAADRLIVVGYSFPAEDDRGAAKVIRSAA